MRVLVVCARQYNGHELWTSLMMFQNEGVEFEVLSTDTLIEDEVTHDYNTIERTLDDFPTEELLEYDGLMFVSGDMDDTELYWDDDRAQNLVSLAGNEDMPIAAICCSVPTIASVAKGKRVSFYPLVRSRQLLQDHGAILEDTAITVDGKLVTAEHQMATQMWAENFIDVLNEKEPRHVLTPSTVKFNQHERMRKPIPELENIKRKRANITGPERCPNDGYHTTVREGKLICPKCKADWTNVEVEKDWLDELD